jgi:hypothetical protein
MRASFGLLVVLFVLICSNATIAGPAQSTDESGGWAPDCAVPLGWINVPLADGLPAVLKRVFAGTVMPGDASFTGGDEGGASSRFLFVWKRGGRWIIATEVGGIAYSQRVQTYQVSSDGRSTSQVMPTRYEIGQRLCIAAEKAAAP